jgi:hypothetical protein
VASTLFDKVYDDIEYNQKRVVAEKAFTLAKKDIGVKWESLKSDYLTQMAADYDEANARLTK